MQTCGKKQEKDNLGFWPHFAEYGQLSIEVIALTPSARLKCMKWQEVDEGFLMLLIVHKVVAEQI